MLRRSWDLASQRLNMPGGIRIESSMPEWDIVPVVLVHSGRSDCSNSGMLVVLRIVHSNLCSGLQL